MCGDNTVKESRKSYCHNYLRKEVPYRGHRRPYITMLEGGLPTETATWFWVNFKIKNDFFCPMKKRNVCPFWQNETMGAYQPDQARKESDSCS